MTLPQYPIQSGITLPKKSFPGGSKSRVSRAGDAVRAGTPSPEDLAVIDTWRAAHRNVLNTFQAILRTRTRSTEIVVAQRHKRKRTIFDKLQRFPAMELARMDDVAGCRLIFPDLDGLYRFRDNLHQAKFRHRLRNSVDKWNYIKRPKATGYRGIHDVYEYDVNSENGRLYEGLLLEVQYRTAAQHAWATCVEVVGFITHSQPKFQRGDYRYETIMAYASELIARNAEQTTSCFPDMPNLELIERFVALDKELGLLKILRGLNTTSNDISSEKNVILMFSEGEQLQVKTYRRSPEALKALFSLEQENPGKDIVLVRADTSDDVRIAFRNYFSDATEFISLVDRACQSLGGVTLPQDK
ncbi:RelA/SpoT domain-containing protein [Edaphobacter modestus]|uniref:RelA/SpoT family protein n=1 Tax=Edaphobacter modestus TaxID=388466 RepID=A0A4Q7XX31_9BACT|nr:RelA/SpoT domain-containing protein [Edaphobacter modestus]RZU28927.1 RelA/SpoT family protein [Edaphobacter modestus]